MKSCRVKFINNKSYWYSGDYEIGDLVYCPGTQEGILGKVVEKSDRPLGLYCVKELVGHIELENISDLDFIWDSITKQERINIMLNLTGKDTCSRKKYHDYAGNVWTSMGYKGESWETFLDYIESLTVLKETESEKDETVLIDGRLCCKMDELPYLEDMKSSSLYNGVLYGPYDWIEPIIDDYGIYEIVEYHNGIFRAKFKNIELMRDHPEFKIIFFSTSYSRSINPAGYFAAYSASGYPFVTKERRYFHYYHNDNDEDPMARYYPDEYFIESVEEWDPYNGLIYSSSFDKEIREEKFIFNKDGEYYQIIDMNCPDSEWKIIEKEDGKAFISRYAGNSTYVEFPSEINCKRIYGIDDRFGRVEKNYSNLETVVIPEGYELIGAYAFEGCKNLRKVTLPDSLCVIGDGAFMKCESLTEITIPEGIGFLHDTYTDKRGGRVAFLDCKALKKVYTKGVFFDYEDSVFFGTDEVQIIPVEKTRNDALSLINENKYRRVMETLTNVPNVLIGDKIILRIQEGRLPLVIACTERDEYLGYVYNGTQIDYPLVQYVNLIDAYVVEDSQPYMGIRAFKIELKVKMIS